MIFVLPLALLLYSGSLKWLGFWPIDPTLLGLIVTFACLAAVSFMREAIWIGKKAEGVILLIFLLAYASTAIYTSSHEFWAEKIQSLVLLFVAFCAPPILIRDISTLKLAKKTFFGFGTAVSTLILFAFSMGKIEDVIGNEISLTEIPSPDYLSIGLIVGLAAILALEQRGFTRVAAILINSLALIALTGRGPIVAYAVVLIIISIRHVLKSLSRVRLQGVLATFTVIGLATLILLKTDIGDVLVARFSGILSVQSFESAFRIGDLEASWLIIREHPVLGVGIGGYGEYAFEDDSNYYPHNLILEILVESGIVGLLFSLGFILSTVVRARLMINQPEHRIFVLITVFYLINYLKSGGLIGARDLFMMIGFLYINFGHQGASRNLREESSGFHEKN